MSQGSWGAPPGGGWAGGPPDAPPGGGGYGPPGGGFGPPGGGFGPPGGFGPGGMAPPPPPRQLRYADVPWYRKSGIHSAFVLLGFFCFPPLLWTTCVLVLTGPIYLDSYDERGQLKQWGVANKVVAALLLLAQLGAFASRLAR